MEVKCVKGTREKFMIKKGEIYLATDDGDKWLLVESNPPRYLPTFRLWSIVV